ncbi:hypothetical protein BDN70DRAFT_879256 [Pholiota conissans]|uniref:Transmembrane protein n=1 Tax=Pholiota conissans TaxID=109636 RepID=A0A9P6D049_9AGAR|nr:hypothetical protein BDN70DRAFT_879256 [Pholiota conissans]
MSQWLRVDDFDRRINYSSEGWTALQLTGVTSDDYDFRNLQDAFMGTTHVVVGTDLGTESSFSFTFNGSAVAIYGMYVGLSAACLTNCTAVDVPVPSWACSIDGEPVQPNDAFGHFPWTSYCEMHDLSDGPHTITTHVFHRNVSMPSGFYLDFIQYLPDPSLDSDLEQGHLMIDSTDPQIPFAENWTPLGTANMTLAGGDFWLEFTGISLIWYSLSPHAIHTLDPSLLKNETVAGGILCTYTIDGMDPVSFMIGIGPDTINPNTYNNILLQTATLPAGKHNLSVSGFGFGHPTTLDYLIVQQVPLGSNAAASTAISPGSSPTAVTQENNSGVPTHNRHVNVGAVAGGAIGATLLLIAMVIGFLFFNRRRSNTTDVDSIFDAEPLPAHIRLEPFKYSLDKPPKPTPSGASDTTVDPADTTAPSSQTKKPTASCLHIYSAPISTSSSALHLPLNPPITPSQDTTIDTFIDSDIFRASDTNGSTFTVDRPEVAASSSRTLCDVQLPPDEHPSDVDAQPPRNTSPPDHGTRPSDRKYQGAESAEFLHLEEHDDVLGDSLRSTFPAQAMPDVGNRRTSRVVRHADSGIRIARRRHSDNILELPPEYNVEYYGL